jgi:hypothetical protein
VSDTNEDAATFQPGDPRPTFDGAWNSATVAEREAHNGRIRAWKEAQGIALSQRTGGGVGEAQRPMAAGSGRVAATAQGPTLPPDATRAVLIGIRDDPQAHDADRIRAAQALIGMEREAQAQSDGPSPLVALRQVLDTLAPHERLSWLQGERVRGMGDAQSA